MFAQPPPGPPPLSNGTLQHGGPSGLPGPAGPAGPPPSASGAPAAAAAADSGAGPSHADADSAAPGLAVVYANSAEEPLPAGWEMRYDVYGRRYSPYIDYCQKVRTKFSSHSTVQNTCCYLSEICPTKFCLRLV